MEPINTDLLRSSEPTHVKMAKLAAYRNLLYAHGAGEALIRDALQEAGGGTLPVTVDGLATVSYIVLEAVEAVLIDLLASIIGMRE